MIIIMEDWSLKPGLEGRALEIMQEMDDLLGPPAHVHPGWCGHASFYQSASDPRRITMLYPWRSRELHDDLVADEEPRLADFYQRYCAGRREIRYFTEMPVEVEHDHDHGHGLEHGQDHGRQGQGQGAGHGREAASR